MDSDLLKPHGVRETLQAIYVKLEGLDAEFKEYKHQQDTRFLSRAELYEKLHNRVNHLEHCRYYAAGAVAMVMAWFEIKKH